MMDYANAKWKLRACRAQAGYSQAEVAKFVGVTDKSLVDWENGYSSPTMEKAQKLVELYEIPLEHMDFSKEGNKQFSRYERQVALARKMAPDEVVEPQY